MALTNNNNDILDDYYGIDPEIPEIERNHPVPITPCNNSENYRSWGIPYDPQEFIYWIIKMLVLPTLVTILVIFYVILPTFQNPIFVAINSILGPIAGFFFIIMVRESIRAGVNYIPNTQRVPSGTSLNNIDEDNSFKIGFVGDIMMMRDHELIFDPAVKTFFCDVKLIVGNLEGIVINEDYRHSQQRHLPVIPGTPATPSTVATPDIPGILTQLERVLSPNINWLLCLSNNHSIDYGNLAFHDSLIHIQTNPRFNVFGRNDVRNVLIQGWPISIASGTEWSNQNTWTCTTKYKNTELWTYHNDVDLNGIKRFNILFPHWGYENERYVRKRIQYDAKALLNGKPQTYTSYQSSIRERLDKEILPDPNGRKWDLIFGQHSHTPQPIMMVDDKVTHPAGNEIEFNKLVAFSGGNFTSGAWIIRRKKHIYGTIMKCDIGPLTECPTKLAVGNVEWRTTINVRRTSGNQKYKTVKIYSRSYRTFAHYLWQFLLAVGIIALIYLLRYLDSIL